MKITIAHLFYDLLNLYGESGNILALQNALTTQGIEVEIKKYSLNDENWQLDDVDILYMGSGTESSTMLTSEKLKEYSKDINELYINNKVILATGTAIELLGQKIIDFDASYDGLGLFDYITTRTKSRIVSECVFSFEKVNSKILGFENHQGEIENIKSPLFTVEKGFGSTSNLKVEGIMSKNLYATYLIGPLLVRNPEFLEYICKIVILNKDPDFTFKDFNLDLEKKAHDKFLEKYSN